MPTPPTVTDWCVTAAGASFTAIMSSAFNGTWSGAVRSTQQREPAWAAAAAVVAVVAAAAAAAVAAAAAAAAAGVVAELAVVAVAAVVAVVAVATAVGPGRPCRHLNVKRKRLPYGFTFYIRFSIYGFTFYRLT